MRMEHNDSENSFIELVEGNSRLIYKVCSFYCSGDLPLADLYQDVVCNLWRAWPRFRGECLLSTWIYRISLNTCISALRRDVRRPQRVPLETASGFLSPPEDMQEQLRDMYDAIRRLRSMERAVVLLWLEERSYREISEITGLSPGNVGTLLGRTKDKLKRMLNPEK